MTTYSPAEATSSPPDGFAAQWDDEIIGVIGDTHTDGAWLRVAVTQLVTQGVSRIVQVGDFGFWPRRTDGRRFLDELNDLLESFDAELVFVRGNHEDQDVLEALAGGRSGLVPVRSRILYAPDGVRVLWGRHNVVFVGGAPSIDKDVRDPGYDWFPTEILSQEGYLRTVDGGKADIVFAHDCPAGIPLGNLANWAPGNAHRDVLRQLADTIRPHLWIHGHYHRRRSFTSYLYEPACQVESLSMNGSIERAVVVVDQKSLTVGPLPEHDNRIFI